MPYVGDSKRALDEYTSELMLGGTNTLVLHNTCEVWGVWGQGWGSPFLSHRRLTCWPYRTHSWLRPSCWTWRC